MEKNSFAMAKFGLEHKEAMPRRDCGFYLKYIFLFTSLIQFLIILGLVLFMVYGNAQAGTDTHLRLLEEQVQSHYRRIVTLGATNANLSRALNATLKDRDRLQGVAGKVQRELDRCNSSQAGGGPQLQELVYLQVKLVKCHMTATLINTSCSAEKLHLQRQLDQTSSAKKTLEETSKKTEATLARATQDRDRCQQDLQSTRTELEFSRTELELQRHECRAAKSDIGDKLPRLVELAKQSRCGDMEDELRQMQGRTEGLFRWQQDRDTRYVRRNACELSVQQCHLNCSREMQDMEKRIQGLERREREGKEERERMEALREKEGKEAEEKRRAAVVQVEALREQLGVCMGAKMPHLDVSGARVAGSASRSGSFPGTGSYLDFLRNPAMLGTLGKKDLEELQRMLQVMEQFPATLKSPSG